jgi:hypothetical protein
MVVIEGMAQPERTVARLLGRRQGRGMVRNLVVLAFVAVLGGTAPALAAEAADKFRHEGWSGRAVLENGTFRQCHMWMAAINNWDLGLALEPSGELKLGLRTHTIDQFWQMLFGQKTALRIQVDQGPVLIRAFTSVTPRLLSASLKNTDWDQRLASGKDLKVNMGGRVRRFHLTGIKEAMGKLRACVAKHRTA